MNTDILYISNKKFVYFNEDGNLLSVGNSNTDEGLYLEVDTAEVYNLITGQEQFHAYQVIFDTIKKSYVLKHRSDDDEVVFDINTQVHRVPTRISSEYRPDLTIVQDTKNLKWIFKLDESIKENLKTKQVSWDRPLMFSITRFNDPHQLERYIIIRLTDLVNSDFEIIFENQIEQMSNLLSVYTIKRFETYYHEVINE
jgi:hypothetical protein